MLLRVTIFRYYYNNDEGQDNGMGMRATGDYLEQAAINLCTIFQVNAGYVARVKYGKYSV
jgi:hypothetical protein